MDSRLSHQPIKRAGEPAMASAGLSVKRWEQRGTRIIPGWQFLKVRHYVSVQENNGVPFTAALAVAGILIAECECSRSQVDVLPCQARRVVKAYPGVITEQNHTAPFGVGGLEQIAYLIARKRQAFLGVGFIQQFNGISRIREGQAQPPGAVEHAAQDFESKIRSARGFPVLDLLVAKTFDLGWRDASNARICPAWPDKGNETIQDRLIARDGSRFAPRCLDPLREKLLG